MRHRGFEIVKGYENAGINLPVRKTQKAVGYDIEAAEDVIIPPFKNGVGPTIVKTGVKAYCEPDEWFMIISRSSGPKKGLMLANSIGAIDSDYYNNETNDGHILFQYYNMLDHDITIKKGDAIGQVIFQKYLIVDDDNATGVRTGGFGSTDIK